MTTQRAKSQTTIGAQLLPDGGVQFRVWAARRRRVDVVIECAPEARRSESPRFVTLNPEAEGYFSGKVAEAGPGTLYRYRLDGEGPFADPASRFQPEGPFGPSEVIDPHAFAWADPAWKGIARRGQAIYELHIGTFTPEGTWDAAARQLATLAELGVTVLQVLPVADFPGRFGWGYDGVDMFAPTRLYGRPDNFRRFVDQAHAHGLGVILDVVYNHFGPEGDVHKAYSIDYITDRYPNEWGEAINFDGENSGPVREFFLQNAAYWIDEFHLDGLRVDATQQFFDASPEHILVALVRRVRAAARGRPTFIVGETESQDSWLARPPEQGGAGFDALWSEDFHHVCMIPALGVRVAYYADYCGRPQEFVSLAKRGFLYQGQLNRRQRKRRGQPATGLEPEQFVFYLQNHDQVANTLRGTRFHAEAAPAIVRALTAFLLLAPATPMLFQGQEYGASTPFLYFGEHDSKLARAARESRATFLSQFPNLALPETKALLADPKDPETFRRSKLDQAERARNQTIVSLHRDLLRLRREDPVLSARRPGGVDGAVLGDAAFAIRYFGQNQDDRLLVVNFGCDVHLDPVPEPLLAPLEGKRWTTLWSSEDPRYGGRGTPALEREDNWHLPAFAAVVLAPAADREGPDA